MLIDLRSKWEKLPGPLAFGLLAAMALPAVVPSYTHAQSYRPPGVVEEVKPPQAVDWRVPFKPRVIPAPVDGIPAFYRAQPPFAQLDWPVSPIPLEPPAPVQGINLLLQTFVAPVDRPFTQSDWPLAQRIPPPSQLDFSRLPGVPAETAPFKQLDWPIAAPTPPFTHPHVSPSFIRVFAPFAQYDWPLSPRPVVRPASTQGLNLPLQSFVPEERPFAQYDWPVPAIPFSPPAPVSGINLPLQTFVAPVDRPFVQTEWPVPPIPPPHHALEYHRLPAQPLAEDRPFSQTEWPRPARIPRFQHPQISQDFLQIFRPVWQTEWPLPDSPPTFTHAATDDSLPVFYRVVVVVDRPFFQLDWPNPDPIPPVLRLESYRLPGIAAEIQPFTQTEWPVPDAPPMFIPDDTLWLVGVYSAPPPAPSASRYDDSFRRNRGRR